MSPDLRIPDFVDVSDVSQWIGTVVEAATVVSASSLTGWHSVSGEEVVRGFAGSPMGLFGYPPWRRFVLGLLAADWASYAVPVDQVNFERLAFIASTFPRGFRLFLGRTEEAQSIPVGYSAWHPMSNGSFRLLRDHAAQLVDRTVLPLSTMVPAVSDVYLFNYSVAPGLRGSDLARSLVKEYAREVTAAAPRSLTAITVSEDGSRVAAKFGMSKRTPLVVDGALEDVYIWER